ncbi:MAG: TIGR03905 family TSCPD domain-containing protein [Oscillospiraceae bacterium]|nr:TIGR03905 family TSCPD domain-containing protein [Candidatus Equicaccousia limihippi]
MKTIYKTFGTCSQMIEIETDGDIIKSVEFIGGCSGNTQGVAKLCEGKKIDEVIGLLKGIKCGFRPTSCPDQLALALEQIKEKK